VQRGWIWNTKKQTKQVLYVLRIIALDQTIQMPVCEMSTQTNGDCDCESDCCESECCES
ncbi:MAG: hypothetical protein RLZZ176_1414, partial [Cyanobacteriota bacterium]